jgi:hypothetical protein
MLGACAVILVGTSLVTGLWRPRIGRGAAADADRAAG